MPNNLVFNNVASELQTQIFGKSGSNLVPINVDTSGNLMVSTVTAVFSGGTVTVSGGTIDVLSALSAGTVTVRGGTVDVVSALSAGTVTVRGGTIDVLSALSAGTVTVRGGTVDVVSALSAGTVTVRGGTIQTTPVYTSSNTTVVLTGTATVDALVMDTSIQRMYSFYVKNIGASNTLTALLQISPSNTATYYVNDSSTSFTLGPGGIAVLVPALFLNYTKLVLQSNTTDTATAQCYFNSQS